MAILKRDPEPGTDGRNTASDGGLSIIAAGMTVTGEIESTGVVKIEGHVEGTIRAARQVLIGRQGSVKGDVFTREAIIGGKLDGNATASERAEVQATAAVTGDVHTKSIVVVEGGQINGHVRMNDHIDLEAANDHPSPALRAYS